MYDIYGRGWSEAMSVLMFDSVVVSQLVKLLLSLKIGKLIFVGWCAGCILVTSVLFTSRYPDRVVGIVNLAGHNTPIYSEYTNCILSAAASAVVRGAVYSAALAALALAALGGVALAGGVGRVCGWRQAAEIAKSRGAPPPPGAPRFLKTLALASATS